MIKNKRYSALWPFKTTRDVACRDIAGASTPSKKPRPCAVRLFLCLVRCQFTPAAPNLTHAKTRLRLR